MEHGPKEKVRSEDEFHYSETKREILTINSIDDIQDFEQLTMIYSVTEKGVEVWNDERGFEGILEVKTQGYSSASHLRAIRFSKGTPTDSKPQYDFKIPASIQLRIVDALKRYCNRVSSTTPVTVRLTRIGDTCRVTFIDKNDDILQEVEHSSIPDLRALLQWPLTHSESMHTDTGQFVSWNIFEDIEYSDMDFLRPLVIYRATRTAPEELPSQLNQFFETPEEITVEITHDRSVCPLALEEGKEHGECWQILHHKSVPRSLKRQLEGHMTGRIVHGFLASGLIWSGRLFELKIEFDYMVGSAECLVFQEDKWIRRLLRERKVIYLPSIPSGSYLREREEKWSVLIEIDNGQVYWNAISTLTKRRFNPYTQSFPMDFTEQLVKEHSRILSVITMNLEITTAEIKNLAEVEKGLTEHLEMWGYGKMSPLCELFVEIASSGHSLILKLRKECIEHQITKLTYQIDKNDIWEAIVEGFVDACSEGMLSQYNIVNMDDANERFNEVQEILVSSDEDDEQEDEDYNLSLENAQRWMESAMFGIGMKEYESALRSIETSLGILNEISNQTEEVQLIILGLLLMKDGALEKQELTPKEYIEEMKELLDNLETKTQYISRPLYEQKIIDQVQDVLIKRKSKN